jgi:hypothetical protein
MCEKLGFAIVFAARAAGFGATLPTAFAGALTATLLNGSKLAATTHPIAKTVAVSMTGRETMAFPSSKVISTVTRDRQPRDI